MAEGTPQGAGPKLSVHTPVSSPTDPRPTGTVRSLLRRWGFLTARGGDIRTVSRDLIRWAVIAVPIGLVAGLGSALFLFSWQETTNFLLVDIVGITYPYAGAPVTGVVVWGSSFPRILLLPVVMTGGALAAGLLIQYVAPETAGHGTDEAINSFHRREGKVRRRVPFMKIVTSVLTLASGGSGGREGPTAQVGAGFGSWWADLLHLPAKDRRIALATGLGAGVGAIFKAPLGGAIYAAEIMYMGDFEPEVFVPAIIASVVSYSTYGLFYGFNTLFETPAGLGWTVDQIPLYALLGLLCAASGVGFIWLYGSTEHRFSRLRLPLALKVTLGGLASSAVVLATWFLLPEGNHFAALASVNVGYGFVQAAMLGQIGAGSLTLILLIVLGLSVLVRMVTTSFTIGSGGSAGLFGTSVVVGALIGSTLGGLFHLWLPGLVSLPDVAAFAIVGMMSFFGGISKAPLAVLVMVVEMAGGYALLLPAMLAIFIAYAATGRYHIYTAQVTNRLASPAHREELRAWLLEGTPVRAIAKPPVGTPPGATVQEAINLSSQSGVSLLLVGAPDAWVGMLRSIDLMKVPPELRGKVLVADLARPLPVKVTENANALETLRRLNAAQADVACLVSVSAPDRVVGLVDRQGILHLLEGEPLEGPIDPRSPHR